MTRLFLIRVMVGISLLALAACESAEERAEAHFQDGLALIEEGDIERALVEFRNVFKLDGQHKQARLKYAEVQAERGNSQEAYSQYLRVVEQYPGNLQARRALAVQAARNQSWEEAERHGRKAADIAPDDPVVRSVIAQLDYRQARIAENAEARQDAVARALSLIDDHPKLDLARRVLVDERLSDENWQAALELIDAGLSNAPSDRELLQLRLGVLEQLGRTGDLEAQLTRMVEEFPDDRGMHRTLLRWYVREDEIGKAESYLRDRIETAEDPTQARLELVQFLEQVRGRDAARDELDRILASEGADQAFFRSVRAGMVFGAGERQAAVTEMEDILESAEPSEQTRRIKVALAGMRTAMGNTVGARALVEEVLKADPTQVEALKLRAEWRIRNDQTGDAILDLRTALDQAPEDPELMTLMARAHERDGNRRLMGEMLSLAVEASGQAPEESLRYAKYLIEKDSLRPAEDVLSSALRLAPRNTQLLSTLGSVYLQLENWSQADSTVAKLEQLETQASRNAANELTAQKLALQDRQEELRGFLENLQAEGEAGLRAEAAIVSSHLAEDDIDAALAYTERRLEEAPDNQSLRFLRASVLAVAGRADEAETMFREILSEAPKRDRVWLALYNLKAAQGRNEAAGKVLERALSELPDNARLLWVEASRMTRRGDTEEAITIYERLYERNSDSVAVANNLASLISSSRDSPESLQRAYSIARRLRNSEVPAFRDTYGWIAFRLGNHEEALDYLQDASSGMPDNATVQYHLARTYAALGRDDQALEQFRRVAELAGGDRSLPFMDTVRAEIERLSTETSETADAATETGTAAQSN